MHVLIPAGGRGVRLQPLTNDTPKPLLLLGDRPILTRIVESVPFEVPVTVLVTPALASEFHAWRDALPSGRAVTIYVERPGDGSPRGPVTALAECIQDSGVSDDLLVMMGDSLLPFTVRDFLGGGREAEADQVRLAAHRLDNLEDARRFGVLEWDNDLGVRSFEEKPAVPRSPWVFTGCFYLPRRLTTVLCTLSQRGLPQVGHLIAALVAGGEHVSVFPVSGEWHDIGTYRSYIAAHEVLMDSYAARRGAGVVWISPSAEVTDSLLEDCVVHSGSRVRRSRLTRCVVQPGVVVEDQIATDRLFTPEGDLPLDGSLSADLPGAGLPAVETQCRVAV